jgi:hypothetical protein
VNWGRRRRTQPTDDNDDERPAEALSDSDEEVASNGLRSRKRMHEAYQIISQNDMDRRGGREDYFISVSEFGFFFRVRYTDHCNSKPSLRNSPDTLLHSKLEMVEGVRLSLRRRIASSCRRTWHLRHQRKPGSGMLLWTNSRDWCGIPECTKAGISRSQRVFILQSRFSVFIRPNRELRRRITLCLHDSRCAVYRLKFPCAAHMP